MERIVQKRGERPYQNLEDFLRRTRAHEDETRALAHAGALDALPQEKNRASLLWQLACYHHRDTVADAAPLFPSYRHEASPTLHPPSRIECLRREYEVLGFLCSHHPLTLCGTRLEQHRRTRAVDLHHRTGNRIWFAGWLLTGKLVRTKSNEPMEFFTFEDETGLVETTFFPLAYRQYAYLLRSGHPYWLWGLVEEDYGAVTLTVEKVKHL
jgi:DNA polymerase-3 subunit alpha/error-prone DNA polymerase